MIWEVLRVYAVIQTGGKQYRVQQGDVIYIEKLGAAQDSLVNFDVLLLGRDDGLVVGTPLVESAKVTGKVLGDVKSAKITVYKFKAKKNYRRKQGHRQPYTKVEITQVG
jgi:large subunit ribosomal protein L21